MAVSFPAPQFSRDLIKDISFTSLDPCLLLRTPFGRDMAAAFRSSILLLTLLSLLLVSTFGSAPSPLNDAFIDLDISELEDLDVEDSPASQSPTSEDIPFDEFDSDEDFGVDDDELFGAAIHDPDVVVLTGQNFSDFINNNHYVMVEFYAPWCGHCQALAPEYAAAATLLKQKEYEVPLAKVDATSEFELAQKYEVQGYPTLFFFVDGVPKPYASHRTQDAIVSWVKKKIGPPVTEVLIVHDAETILETGNTIAVAFFDKFEGPEAEEYTSAARQEDDVLFYQTKNEDVAEVFNIKKGTKAPALVLLKNLPEKVSHYDAEFERGRISEFILANKLPLVTTFSRDTASELFESHIKKQMLLFVDHENSEKVLPIFEEAAKLFKGQILFVHVDSSDKDVGQPILEFFGVTGDKPTIVGFTVAAEQSRKYTFEDEMTVDRIKVFGDSFLADKLKQFYKSSPIPEKNDDDVKIVVGKNFDEIVLDESKDVLLEIYAPWCGHCQAFEPTYKKLGRVFRSIDSVVIAKMDGTTNEHARAKTDGFPTLLFFPAGNKSFDPITVDTDRTVKALYQFLKKNVAIPFTLPKPEKPEVDKVKPVDDPRYKVKDEL
eukprot:c19966_g2_i1 orf=88-1899(+)